MSRRNIEIDSEDAFTRSIAKTDTLTGWFVQSVDLTGHTAALASVEVTGAVFLGCSFEDGVENFLRDRGALIFPSLPNLPFDPYRGQLYDAAELYGDADYADGPDARIYAWSSQSHRQHDIASTLAMSLHDHAITDALDDATADVSADQVVGVMGGHALRRGTEDYRQAALLGGRLALAGFTALTGGGPGAMEAANLGAYLSGHVDESVGLDLLVDAALPILAAQDDFHSNLNGWAAAAMTVRDRWPADRAGHSIGIPTWFYGHEPPNAFATEIAKYFTNALREDTLLARCRGGIIYLPGAAGTVQEVFQAVTENYYAAHLDNIAPLVLVDVEHWTEKLPAWPLLQALGRDRAMGTRIHCVDTVDEAIGVITDTG